MTFGHEKLDVYQIVLKYVQFAWKLCEDLTGHYRHARDQLLKWEGEGILLKNRKGIIFLLMAIAIAITIPIVMSTAMPIPITIAIAIPIPIPKAIWESIINNNMEENIHEQ